MIKIKISKEQIKEMYLSGKNALEISKIAGCNVYNIYAHLKRMGVKRRTIADSKRKYPLNEYYFQDINSEEKAYILGFLYADGYNQESRNQVRITLEQTDKHILEKIRSLLFINNDKPLMKISKNQRVYYDLAINSHQICSDLAKHGCVQKKTFKLTFPTFLKKDLLIHFIRGYFDGDGCISITKRNNRIENSKSYQFNIAGRKEFVTEIQKILHNKINLGETLIKQHENIYYVQYGGLQNVYKVLFVLYKNATIYLERKYQKYLSIREAVMFR